MTIASAQIDLTTERTTLASAPLNGLITVRVRNRSASAQVYLGGADVSSSSGYALDAGDELALTLWPLEALLAMSSSAATVHTLEGAA